MGFTNAAGQQMVVKIKNIITLYDYGTLKVLFIFKNESTLSTEKNLYHFLTLVIAGWLPFAALFVRSQYARLI